MYIRIDGQDIPVLDDLASMSLGRLKAEKKRLGPIYSKRFELKRIEEYMAIMVYLSICTMIQNIENNINRWHRIDNGRENSDCKP